MPKDNKNIPDFLNNEANLSIYADHLGLTPQYVKENKDKLLEIEKKVRQSLKEANHSDPNSVFNTMKVLQRVTERTYVSDSYDTNLEVRSNPYGALDTNSGFRMIYGENENREDAEIFNFHASIFSNYRNLVSEYRNIGRLIPEVYRCADMKSRDILAINEITKKAITNIYQPDSNDPDAHLPQNLILDPINKTLQEKILDKYKVEDKLPRYLKTSLIEGAKPVVVYPFKDIVEMANYNMNLYRRTYKDFEMNKRKSEQSGESLTDFLTKYHNKYTKLIPEEANINYKLLGREDVNQDDNISYKETRDKIIDKYISQEDLNEYYVRGREDISDNLNKAEHEKLMEIYGSNVIDKTEQINETKEKFRDLHAKVKAVGELSNHFKDQIYNAIKTLDTNVQFYDESDAPIAMAINNFRRIMQFTAYHEDPKSGLIAYGAQLQPDKKLKDSNPFMDRDNPNKLLNNNDKPKSLLDEFEDFDQNSRNILNDCLIKEYDAEDVIPVIVSGKHVGYYVIELAPYTGNVESINKRNCNFTDMFINLGMSNDMALSPSPSVSGSFSAGVQHVPLGGTGPTSEVGPLGITGAGSTAVAGGLDIAGYDTGPGGTDAMHRNNIMKKIMFNVLKEKLKRNDLEDDETFTETIMSLIRDGAIVQKRVKIIYVPEKYMCYFTPELDGNGIPQSFMKNCLFTCYEKILVNMNNIMTRLTRSGTRDKLTINIGKAKNMGYSIRSIENALTTRRLNVESPFTSLSRVLKSASLAETIIVPAFEGEKLFEYEDLTRTNDVQPQDDLEQKLTNDIVTSLKCPITIINPYQEEDFASLAASRNAEYRFDIIKQQQHFTDTIEKFIKLLIVGSGVYEDIKTGTPGFSLRDIHVVLSPPEALNMKNANEMFSTVSSYVENLIGIVINPDDSNEVTNMQRWLFKQKLYQEFMPGIDIETYINKAEQLKIEATKKALSQKIDDSTNKQVVNTEIEPLVATPDGQVLEAGHAGVSESEDADMGSW